MRQWLWFLSFLIMLTVPLVAQAVSMTLQWTPVTTNVDGTPAVVDSYTFYRSIDGGLTFKLFPCQEATMDPKLLGRLCTDAVLPVGNDCYEAHAVNLQGEGPASNRLCFSVPSAKPGAPGTLSVRTTTVSPKLPLRQPRPHH